jgi:hypothetical protein
MGVALKEIAFLTYLNRSGSTWLASLLDQYAEIGVSPEARIPDGIAYGSIGLQTPSDANGFVERLYADFKFRAWKIDKDLLRKRIQETSFPVGFDRLLPLILNEYFKDDVARIYIYKSPYHRHIEAARQVFAQEKFIFLVRDIRAVYNSQKRSIGSTTGKAMSENPVTTAMLFKQVSSMLDRVSKEGNIHLVRYEDLVRNKDNELKRISEFLGAPSEQRIVGKPYLQKIVPQQKHLHSNVQSSALKNRIEAWQDELTRLEIMTLQRVAKDELVTYGYPLFQCGKFTLLDRVCYYLFWLKHWGRNLKKTAVGVRMIWRSPRFIKKGHLHLVAPNLSRAVDTMISRLRLLKK